MFFNKDLKGKYCKIKKWVLIVYFYRICFVYKRGYWDDVVYKLNLFLIR